jgi:outer membrane protein TolC
MSWNNRRLESTSSFNTFNPQYNSTFQAIFTQPLLRNFRTDSTRAQIRVTRINRDISDIQVQATITNTLASVRHAYWDLVFASESVSVARRSLDLATKLVEDNKVRVEVGAMAPIDVVQAEAEAANRRLALAQAEATRQTAELTLKRLIVSGTDDPLWTSPIDPIDRPSAGFEPIDIDTAVRAALDRRTDLRQSRRQRDANDISVEQLRNQTLPGLDFVATYGLQGIGGTQFIRTGGLGGQVLSTIPGGFGDALALLRDRSYPTWNLQLQLSYPLGGSPADAQYARARITVRQTEAQIRALELQVATEVTGIALQVRNNLTRLEAARAARELTEKQLEAEQSKFEVGLSTNFFVVQAQRDLADAQNTELRALLDYRKSVVDFERVQETALSRAGITVVGTGNTAGGGPR